MQNHSKPNWIKVKAINEESYSFIKSVSMKYNLHTVCQEALCPNISECWSARAATFLLLGDVCTRNCRFCSVKTGNPKGIIDSKESDNIAKAVNELGLNYVVLTSVDRDDLEDGGSGQFAKTVDAIKLLNPDTPIEILIPDFLGKIDSLKKVIDSKPYIIGHNIETVERLSPALRDRRATYRASLALLKQIKHISPTILTKSAIQVGFGEAESEIITTLKDLKQNEVDVVVIGQYLRPSEKQVQVVEYVHPDKFSFYEKYAKSLGFKQVISSPLARSSYKATFLE